MSEDAEEWREKYRELWQRFKAADDLLKMVEDDKNFYRMKARRLETENAYLKEQLAKAKADLLPGARRTK